MFSLENKIGIIGSFVLILYSFIVQIFNVIQFHFYSIYSSNWFTTVISIVSIVINVIILFAFIKEFLEEQNIIILIMGGAFAIYAFIWEFYNIIYPMLFQNGISFHWIYTITRWISALATIILFAAISLKLLKSYGLRKLIGLGGFAYLLIYIVNLLSSFLNYNNSLILAIITAIYGLIPSVLLASYFLFVENE